MTKVQPTPLIEDYLIYIYILARDGISVSGAKLSRLLKVSPPTITNTVKRMVRDGFVDLSDKKEITLTETGKDFAMSILTRHMYAEWLLAESLNVSWVDSHKEAHTLEHGISNKVEEALIKKMERYTTCPHGNPLPGKESLTANWKQLKSFKEGDKIIFRRIHEFGEDTPGVLEYLQEKNILPGTKASIISIRPFDNTITIQIDSKNITLGETTSTYLYAELEK